MEAARLCDDIVGGLRPRLLDVRPRPQELCERSRTYKLHVHATVIQDLEVGLLGRFHPLIIDLKRTDGTVRGE